MIDTYSQDRDLTDNVNSSLSSKLDFTDVFTKYNITLIKRWIVIAKAFVDIIVNVNVWDIFLVCVCAVPFRNWVTMSHGAAPQSRQVPNECDAIFKKMLIYDFNDIYHPIDLELGSNSQIITDKS